GGRHHLVTPGGIIPFYPGGFVGIGKLAELEKEKINTVSARLKVLLTARLLKRRREGQTIFYSIADAHVLNLVDNAIEHACETR
ncbi:MAG: ArsR/SmtB family transcription factor, partial [Roseiarcus sp.]